MSATSFYNRLRGVAALGLPNGETDLQDALLDGAWTFDHPIGITDTAGTDYTYWGMKVPFNVTIVAVDICPHATLTANDTNYATLSLTKSDGAAGSATTVATASTTTTGTGNWAVDTYEPLTVDVTEADVDDGQMLLFEKVAVASGVSVGGCSVTIRYRRR